MLDIIIARTSNFFIKVPYKADFKWIKFSQFALSLSLVFKEDIF